jgi:hypothetical protein
MDKLHPFFQQVQQSPQEQPISTQPQGNEQLHPFFSQPKEKVEQTNQVVLPERTSSIPKQIVKEGAAGLFGAYGDIAELVGVQKEESPAVLPSRQERFRKESAATDKELINLVSEDQGELPEYAKIPSSKDIREAATKFFGIGDAKTSAERYAGKISGAIGGVAALGGGGTAIKASAAGAAAGQTVREAGFSEGIATTVDIGTNLGVGLVKTLADKGTAAEHASKLYRAAETSLPEGASGSATKLKTSLKELNKKMKLGTKAESEKAIINETEELLSKIKDGKMSYQEAVASRRSINEKMMKVFVETPDKSSKARARKLFGQVKGDLNEFIKTAEEKYPEFYKNQVAADQAFATIAQSRFISNFVNDLVKGHTAKIVAAGIGMSHVSPVNILLGIGSYSSIKAGEFAYRFFKSPVLRAHYNDLINSALKENKAGVLNSIRRINKGVEEDPEILELLKN